MFYSLLLVTLALSLVTSLFVATFFRQPVTLLLAKLFDADVGEAWGRYVYFALAVAGVAGGVPLTKLERMIGAQTYGDALVLNRESWILTIFESFLATLGVLVGTLVTYFVVMMIAHVLVRRAEAKRPVAAPPAPMPASAGA